MKVVENEDEGEIMNKEKIALLVDSGTDTPQELLDQEHVFMIPLKIIYRNREYTDKVDITADEILARLPVEVPSTSLPEGEQILAIFDQIYQAGYEKVLAITISSGLSGTYNAVRLLAEQYEKLETFVLDTKNIGIGAGLQAIRANELMEAGIQWQELVAKLEKEVPNNKVFFNVATLEYLKKGGRIGLVSAVIGSALKIQPIISCNEEGVYYTVGKARNRKKGLEKTIKFVKDFVGSHSVFRLAVAHGDALADAEWVRMQLLEQFPQVKEILFGEISPALVVHTGPGLLGVGVQLLD